MQMMEIPKKPHLVETTELQTTEATNIFSDLEKLRRETEVAVHKRQVITTIGVGKPSPTAYFRVPSDENMSLRANILKFEEGKIRANLFVVPAMRGHPRLIERLRPVLLTPMVSWPSRTLSIWPVPLDLSNRWNASAYDAYQLAKSRWMQMYAGADCYTVEDAEGKDLPLPEFGALSLGEMLGIAFKGQIIDHDDCAWMLTIRGIK
jgi:hypothetical protein